MRVSPTTVMEEAHVSVGELTVSEELILEARVIAEVATEVERKSARDELQKLAKYLIKQGLVMHDLEEASAKNDGFMKAVDKAQEAVDILDDEYDFELNPAEEAYLSFLRSKEVPYDESTVSEERMLDAIAVQEAAMHVDDIGQLQLEILAHKLRKQSLAMRSPAEKRADF